MARQVQITFILLVLVFASCKKSEDRSCWKGHGEETNLVIPITGTVNTWYMKKDIKYRFYQDSSNVIIVKGGANMVNLVTVDQVGDSISVENHSKCNFLRSSDRGVEVEVHYPDYGKFFFEPSDSIIFEDTIVSQSLEIQLAFGGGTMVLNTDANFLSVVVSRGTANYVLGGHANQAEVKIQDKGFADATDFTAASLYAYQNSTANLWVNIEGANVYVWIDGPGDVYATGTPNQLNKNLAGGGEFLQY